MKIVIKTPSTDVDLFSKSHINENGVKVSGTAHVLHMVYTKIGSKEKYDKLQQEIGEYRGARKALNEVFPLLESYKKIIDDYAEKEAKEKRKNIRVVPKKKSS